MNKKVLSAILFSALFACTGTFTSCIDNDEPEGIENLRGAKAELLRAKVEVEKANAAFKLAEAEVQKAEAARLNAIAEIKKAEAEHQRLVNERQEITNADAQADLDAKIEAAKLAAEKAALKHQSAILELETQLADAQRVFEITMKQIEIAKALMNAGELQTIEGLEKIVEAKQVAVDKAMIKVKKAEQDVYNVAMNLDKDNAYWTSKLALDLKYAEIALAVAESNVETYKNYIENLENADWYAEIKEIEAELDSLDKEKTALEVAKTRDFTSDEYLALVKALKAEKDTLTAAEAARNAMVLTEDVAYTYKYLYSQNNKITLLTKGMSYDEAGEAIAGENFDDPNAEIKGHIAFLENEKGSYTKEYQEYLKKVAASESLEDLDKAQATATAAVASWTDALAKYNGAIALSTDAMFKAGQNGAADTGHYVTYMEACIAAEAKKKAAEDADEYDETAQAEYNEAILLAKQKFADAIVAYYNTLPAAQVTFGSITLGTEVDGEMIYTSKTAKEWLSDAALKHKNLDKLYYYFGKKMEALWSVNNLDYDGNGSVDGEQKNTNGSVKEGGSITGAFTSWVVKSNSTESASVALGADYTPTTLYGKLVRASYAAFGKAELYISKTHQDLGYLTVQPSDDDIKYVGYHNAGAYGAWLGYKDEDNVFIAKNYEAIIADLTAAITFWTAELEEINTAINAAQAVIDAAEVDVKAADKALADKNDEINLKYFAAEEALAERAMVLKTIKSELEEHVELPDTDGETLENWLKTQIKEAEYAVVEQEAVVLAIEKAIQEMEDGMHASAIALEAAEYRLAIDTRNLEKAQAELAEALANLQTALEIMSAE